RPASGGGRHGSRAPAVPRGPAAALARPGPVLAWPYPVSNSLVRERYRGVKDFLVGPCYARSSGTSCAAVAHQQRVADGGVAPGSGPGLELAGMAAWRTTAGRPASGAGPAPGADATSGRAAIVVVSRDDAIRQRVHHELVWRYSTDYQI